MDFVENVLLEAVDWNRRIISLMIEIEAVNI
jgi:hypothetical protein